MIREGKGNLLAAEVDALVNTVNTMGIMGKGVALQFKQAFPQNFREYQLACKRGDVRIGRMFVTRTGALQPRFIINFPTKEHWKGQAKLEHIQSGLEDLVRVIRAEGIRSVALPPLGCGLGGLRWEHVRPMIEKALSQVPDAEAILFPPGGSYRAENRIVRTARPELTAWRAALIRLVDVYSQLGFEASHQEAQKLLYFLAEAGEPLTTHFAKGEFGPYDPGMRFGLQQMEGHHLSGFGDGRRLDPVAVSPGAVEEARRFLEGAHETEERIGRVARLIEGFETPYGLEVLATVHWVALHEDEVARRDSGRAVELSHAWSDRKRNTLRAKDLRLAWGRLRDQGWL